MLQLIWHKITEGFTLQLVCSPHMQHTIYLLHALLYYQVTISLWSLFFIWLHCILKYCIEFGTD